MQEINGKPVNDRVIVLGTMNFGDTVSEGDSLKIIEAAFDQGVNFIDTANGYAQGATEPIVGKSLKGRREEVILATKGGMATIDSGDLPLLSAKALQLSIDGSLRRLDTDYIDLYYLHQPDRSTEPQETIEALALAIEQGKIRSWGVSNFASWQVLQLIQLADKAGLPRPLYGQNVYNLLARRIEDEWLEFSGTAGIETMVYNPLAGGLLARVQDMKESKRFTGSVLAKMYKDRYVNEAILESRKQLAEVAEKEGLSLLEASLRWLWNREEVTSVLVGASSLDQLNQNIEILRKGALTPESAEHLAEITEPLRSAMTPYNR